MRYRSEAGGIRVSVEPRFSMARSDPGSGTFAFSYDIELFNAGEDDARLLFRHWRIHDASGDDEEVDGEGVVGQQPRLGPGGLHAYRSFCVLRSPVGFMEGYFTFERSDGSRFRVPIPRFDLEAPLPPAAVDDDEGTVLH